MSQLARLVVWSLAGALGAMALVHCGEAYGESEGTPDATDVAAGDGTAPEVDGAGPNLDASTGDALENTDGRDATPCTPTLVRRVFITSMPFSPDQGRKAADAQCQAEADTASLCGVFVAWLSSTGANAIDRLADAPYERIDGARVVDSTAELVSTGIKVAINLTVSGAAPATTKIWTGTKTSGVVDDATCTDWTSNAPSTEGTIGDVGAAGNFTDRGHNPCSTVAHVLCFRQ